VAAAASAQGQGALLGPTTAGVSIGATRVSAGAATVAAVVVFFIAALAGAGAVIYQYTSAYRYVIWLDTYIRGCSGNQMSYNGS
jgi:hypothetical protein